MSEKVSESEEEEGTKGRKEEGKWESRRNMPQLLTTRGLSPRGFQVCVGAGVDPSK